MYEYKFRNKLFISWKLGNDQQEWKVKVIIIHDL